MTNSSREIRALKKPVPNLEVENRLHDRGYRLVAGIDEVGRGAWAGPVTVGVVVVPTNVTYFPDGLADSKFLTEKQRESIAPRVRDWVLCWAVADASPHEIDTFGITASLRLAARRALAELAVMPDAILLDGSHDYIADPLDSTLFAVEEPLPLVQTEVKGDARCASIAAASVLAKSLRDDQMIALATDFPHYGWESNAGYAGAPAHQNGVVQHGLTPWHRRSWKIPDAVNAALALR